LEEGGEEEGKGIAEGIEKENKNEEEENE